MKARSMVVGVLAAGVMLVAGAGSASANIAWCFEDPPVQVQTPAGTSLTVNVSVSVAQGEARFMKSVAVDAVTAPAAGGGTLITVNVSVPTTVTAANVTASVKKFKLSTPAATVPGGGAATLYLVVPAS